MARCFNCGEDRELRFAIISEDETDIEHICELCAEELERSYPEAPPFDLRRVPCVN